MIGRRLLLAGALLLTPGCAARPPEPGQTISFTFWETYKGGDVAVVVDGRTLFDGAVPDAEASTAVSGGFVADILPGTRKFTFRYGEQSFTADVKVTRQTRFIYLTPLHAPQIQASDKAYLLD